MSKQRTLTEWEATISAAVLPLGFTYWPKESGDGYWWDKLRGLQLTDDIENDSRKTRSVWTLKRVVGLKIYTLVLPHRKRTPKTEAAEIVKRLAFLDELGWEENERWSCEDLGA